MPVEKTMACAGSGKTEKLVRDATKAFLEGRCVLIVSMTNMVRAEIAERTETALGRHGALKDTVVRSWGSHNEFRATNSTGLIHAASIDGFVHGMLMANQATIVESYLLLADGYSVEIDDYGGKRGRLLHMLQTDTASVVQRGLLNVLQLDDSVEISNIHFFVDEFQDLSDTMVAIYSKLACALHGSGQISIVGDKMQNVFGHCEDAFASFDEVMREAAIEPTVNTLDTCYRCPRTHIAFVNRLFGLSIKPFKADGHKPLMLCHRPGDAASAASMIAESIYWHIHTYDIPLEDVCVLGATTNYNRLFRELEPRLNQKLASYAPPGMPAVKWFITGQDTGSIDWAQSRGRLSLLSVHAMKGSSRRLVVMTGVTEGVLPANGRQHDSVQRSVLYVGLTRSTEHLLVCFDGGSQLPCLLDSHRTSSCLSRYIVQPFASVDELLQFVSWSVLSHMAPKEIEWPRGQDWAELRQVNRPPTTFGEWAKRIPSVRMLLSSYQQSSKSFADNLTTARGLDHVRQCSLEAAVGLLAQRRLRTHLEGGGEAPRGWLCAADVVQDPHLKASLVAAGVTTESVNGVGACPKWLWNLALVDLAGIEDDIRCSPRPWALDLAASLWERDPEPDLLPVLELCEAIDRNCKLCSEMLAPEVGRVCAFEVPGRVVVPGRKAMINGRADMIVGRTLYEIKASTVQTQDEHAAPPSCWWTQVVLYISMMERKGYTIDRVGIIDVMRGLVFHCSLGDAGSNGAAILQRATEMVYGEQVSKKNMK